MEWVSYDASTANIQHAIILIDTTILTRIKNA